MYIKSIVLDGFKSYGRREEIKGFDPEFTAITGLNGTGKSNILDSICFVLGISVLTRVRADGLQDLVYKKGQAGVNKATVTIIFDNSNKSQCPIGYEKCDEISVTRQVIIGGKNKYLINGKNVQNKKVTDLFCSIQLNVNNPSFLIMQGTISKVINMKPHEVLSTIEEAAGTSLYAVKREATCKIINKKDAKLNEMTNLLKEEIEPKLLKLRNERENFMEYEKTCRDIDYLTRIYISYKYLQFQNEAKKIDQNIKTTTELIETNKTTIKDNDEQMLNIESNVKEMLAKIDEEDGGTLNELEKEFSRVSNEEGSASAKVKDLKQTIAVEERKLNNLSKSLNDDLQILNTKETNMSKVDDFFQNLKNEDETDSIAFACSQKKFEAVVAGLSTNEDGEAASLQDQLIAAEKQITDASITIKQSEMQLKHNATVLHEKQNQMQTNDVAYIKDKKKFDEKDMDMKKLKAQFSKINYQEGYIEELEARKKILTQEKRNIQNLLDQKGAHRYDFHYTDPEPNFNRNRVKGMVCKLFDVRDKVNCLALSVAGGGSLYSIVTDTDTTGKKILEHGQLQSRTTMIPLNKISGRSINQSSIKVAESISGKENCATALSLINYNKELEPVMKFMFGSTFICKNMDIAKKVTYHPQIMCRSVTLEGDVIDPDGTLSGGARPKGGAVLLEIQEIKQLQRDLEAKEREIMEINQEIRNTEGTYQSWSQMKEQLDLLEYDISSIKARLAQTSFQQHETEINNLKISIEKLQEDLKLAKEKQNAAKIKVKDLKEKFTDTKGYRERELKEAEAEMNRLKKKSEKSKTNWKKKEQEYLTLKLEIEDLKTTIEASKESIEKLHTTIKKLNEELVECKKSHDVLLNEAKQMKNEIDKQKEHINSQNKGVRAETARRERLSKNNAEIVLKIKVLENEIKTKRENIKATLTEIAMYEKKYAWIKQDKACFGVRNTRYDYAKENPVEAGEKLAAMKQKKEKMSRNINQKAMLLLEREEDQYNEVIKRRGIVEADKTKIQKIILDLDKKKKEELEKAVKAVDKNIGSIFSSLLPGSQAKLIPTDGKDFLNGIGVKVGFNGLWKESIQELSGGQRSLVALSFILAMLKYKSAPIYILDEVDAALDLSHTQNIGNMLKTHFHNSQFIVVSLKDGMFNNANVLFQTKFVDGMSCVTRTANK